MKKYNHPKNAVRLPGYYKSFVLAGFVVLVGLLAGGWYFTKYHEARAIGTLNQNQTYRGEYLASSLDLKLAAKATYPSAPLRTIKDIDDADGIKEQIVSFGVSVSQLTEYGLMMTPATSRPAQGYPVIILCHGYLNPSEYETTKGYLADMRFYAQHGFVVVKPDFRGQGLSAKEGHPEGAYYSMAYNTDVLSLVSALKQTKLINKSRINIWGHSLGAYIALRAAVLSPDIKNVILLSTPADSLTKMYLTYIPPSDENNLEALKIRRQVFSLYGIPAENTAFWNSASPINYVSR
ncbi:MAG TPA: alpha/beta fold hydrolase, partial [Candidatus Saccharimonadales bacterium]|nr:alpha/beta fold hydrolase [Candidatus Saccharimonadales bacterium]